MTTAGDLPLTERENHCFLSYASEDAVLAKRLADWLSLAGLRVWIDQVRLSAGSPVLDELKRQIWNSRAFLLLLTGAALKKPYVKYEVDTACKQHVEHPDFSMIALRTDPKLDPKERFPGLEDVSWMDCVAGELDIKAARRVLLSLTPAVSKANDARHIYVSCGWGEAEGPITRRVCAPLASRNVRLIGDAADQRRFGENGKLRVRRIMSGCSGHLMVLPDRRPPGKSPMETFKYFLAEWEISQQLGLVRRTFCVSREALPAQLQAEAIEIFTAEESHRMEKELIALHDETEPQAPYTFLATDFRRSITDRNEAARDIIEHALGMECVLAGTATSDQLREAIIDKVIGANFVVADVACARHEKTNRLDPNLNTCIEAGIAMGARRPVFVTSLDPTSFDPEVQDKTTQVPFMFRNSQIQWYDNSVNFLAVVHGISMGMRRRIISDELVSELKSSLAAKE